MSAWDVSSSPPSSKSGLSGTIDWTMSLTITSNRNVDSYGAQFGRKILQGIVPCHVTRLHQLTSNRMWNDREHANSETNCGNERFKILFESIANAFRDNITTHDCMCYEFDQTLRYIYTNPDEELFDVQGLQLVFTKVLADMNARRWFAADALYVDTDEQLKHTDGRFRGWMKEIPALAAHVLLIQGGGVGAWMHSQSLWEHSSRKHLLLTHIFGARHDQEEGP